MGEVERQALAQLMAENESVRAAITGAASPEDAIEVAAQHGITIDVEDVTASRGRLSEADLEGVGGGLASVYPACFSGAPIWPA